MSFATGYRIDVERIGRACRERGIWFVLDAIQGVGAAPLDVRTAHVDVVACGAQKWLLSPWGTGFVWLRPDLVQSLRPVDVSWMATQCSDDFTSPDGLRLHVSRRCATVRDDHAAVPGFRRAERERWTCFSRWASTRCTRASSA